MVFHEGLSFMLVYQLCPRFDVYFLVPNQLRGFEHIRGVILETQPFDVERDLVTPTMKKRRGQILKHYQVKSDHDDVINSTASMHLQALSLFCFLWYSFMGLLRFSCIVQEGIDNLYKGLTKGRT